MEHTLSAEGIEEAAALLDSARRAARVLEHLPGELQPHTLTEAYAIQDRVVALSGESIGGWFLGCTNPEIQRQLGLPAPYSGRLLASALRPSPATLAVPARLQPVIEVEFAFTLGADLPPRGHDYTRAEVGAVIATVHPAIELVTSRLADWTHQPIFDLIADNGTDGALIAGAGVADWRHLDLATLTAHLRVNGRELRSGSGANALGDPLLAMTWLANHRSQAGDGLHAGHIHNTGSVTAMHFASAGEHCIADFGPLGAAELTLA